MRPNIHSDLADAVEINFITGIERGKDARTLPSRRRRMRHGALSSARSCHSVRRAEDDPQQTPTKTPCNHPHRETGHLLAGMA